MAVQLDLVLPPVIVGFLILLIFRVNAFMMDSSVDTRLTNDVQTHSNLIADIIQEELRGLITYDEDLFDENHTSEEFEFVKIVPDPSQLILLNVRIERDERNLIIYRDVDTITESSEKTVIPSQISNLRFSLATEPADDEESETIGDIIPNLIHFHIETESDPEHHVRFRDDKQTVKAVSEREVYLRNRALINLPTPNDEDEDE